MLNNSYYTLLYIFVGSNHRFECYLLTDTFLPLFRIDSDNIESEVAFKENVPRQKTNIQFGIILGG